MKPIRNRKPFYFIIFGLMTLILLIPSLLVLPFNGKSISTVSPKVESVPVSQPIVFNSSVDVSVYRTDAKQVDTLPLEEYVKGVVAAEMPADFEMQALKAQALTARTYIIKMLLHETDLNLPEGADVTDTKMHQVYKSDEELKQIWPEDYAWKINKIAKAVKETEGKVITYEGKPIDALFFSTSNGFTQNSEDYYSTAFPYLKSVESPWDKQSPKYTYKHVLPVSLVEQKLNVQLKDDGEIGKVLSRTSGNYIDMIEIDGKKLNGRDIRDGLELRSTDFTMVKKDDKVIVQTRGYGHGVGMSQYGANGMAKAGKTYKEIVKHYYNGVSITDTKAYTAKLN
ncbi:stage II sporulation protein D [Alkalihalobacillus sp. AL-G]|uniref:stage II sporulation protein D n=1 Tax=Alkalihalobacillus sp. AL-G TaxID=2926399 RepID=UPI00272C2C13|nr:stage II sporulation protein D [Alkalihalobacillus sp. AL-G]WLD93139.1 stage II sporulation protein D [Alkalihalobacillus sp. AL-G]